MSVEEDGGAAFCSPEGSENASCSLSSTSFFSSSKMDSHRVTALKYAFSTAFYNLEKGQKLLHVLLRAALSWMECSGTLQLCWKVFYGADVNFEGEKELPSETVQQLFFLLWGGRFDLTSCCSAVKADFLWGGI